MLFSQETVVAEIKVTFVVSAMKEHGGRVLVSALSPAVATLPVDPDAVLNAGVHGFKAVVWLGVKDMPLASLETFLTQVHLTLLTVVAQLFRFLTEHSPAGIAPGGRTPVLWGRGEIVLQL